jgi:hypothetical protein
MATRKADGKGKSIWTTRPARKTRSPCLGEPPGIMWLTIRPVVRAETSGLLAPGCSAKTREHPVRRGATWSCPAPGGHGWAARNRRPLGGGRMEACVEGWAPATIPAEGASCFHGDDSGATKDVRARASGRPSGSPWWTRASRSRCHASRPEIRCVRGSGNSLRQIEIGLPPRDTVARSGAEGLVEVI